MSGTKMHIMKTDETFKDEKDDKGFECLTSGENHTWVMKDEKRRKRHMREGLCELALHRRHLPQEVCHCTFPTLALNVTSPLVLTRNQLSPYPVSTHA